MENKFFVPRSEWSGVEYRPELLAEERGRQILDALREAMPALNVGAEMAVKYGLKQTYKMGRAEYVFIITDDARIYAGTTGEYPSANMALVVDDGEPIKPQKFYPAGTRFCIIHCQWVLYNWKYNLPMQEGYYRSVRRTLAGHFEERLRQRGI